MPKILKSVKLIHYSLLFICVLGRKLDLLGFDTCLMSAYEVALQLAPYAEKLLASEETEPGHGWQYTYYKVQSGTSDRGAGERERKRELER